LDIDPNERVLSYQVPDVCAKFHQNRLKIATVRARKLCKLWALNANMSKMATGTNFKFGRHAPLERLDRIPEKLFSKGGVAIVT